MEENEYVVVESDESVNTLNQLYAAENLSVNNLLYLLQGVGAKRDRKLSLGSLLAWIAANEKFDTVKFVKDENTNIEIKWDSTHSEFVIWQRSNSGTVAVPKLHVHGTLEVENNTTIKDVLNVNGVLHAYSGALFDSTLTVEDSIIAKKGIYGQERSAFERLNIADEKSYFETSTFTSIETLLAGNSITPSKGDIVVVRNVSGGNDLPITVGTYDQTLGQDYVATLKAYCAMAFVNTGVTGNGVKWAPLGNAEVAVV